MKTKRTVQGWGVVQLGDVLSRVQKPVAVEPDELYREIGIRSHGRGIFHKDQVTGGSLGDKRVFWVEPDCFVTNIVFAWEGAVAQTTQAEAGMIASHRFPMYKPASDLLDLDFLTYFFKSRYGVHLLGLASPGGAGRNKTLGQQEFLQLEIPLPLLAEQRKIADILNTWDTAINLTAQLIAAKQRRKQGLMQRLLTGEVRFGEFEGPAWKMFPVAEFATRSSAKFDPQKQADLLPCIELEHIAQETGQILDTIPVQGQQSIKNRFHAGQVLFGKLRPYLRKYAQPQFDGVCSSEVWVLNGTANVCTNDYLFYLVQTSDFVAAANATSGTKMPRADWEHLSQKSFLLPPLDEQAKIVAVLRVCDEELALHQQKLAALRRQKQGLMQRLLMGEVRVSTGF